MWFVVGGLLLVVRCWWFVVGGRSIPARLVGAECRVC